MDAVSKVRPNMSMVCEGIRSVCANSGCVVKKSGFAMKGQMTHGIVVALAEV